MQKIIGLMGAMPDEIARLYAQMANKKETALGGVTFYEGDLYGNRVVLCCAGMGKANAAATTQLLITHFGAQMILFSGIAGNMSGKLTVGDVVIGKTLLYHDAERRMIAEAYPHLQEFAGDPALIAAAEKACAALGVHYCTGCIATGDDFVGDSATKKSIADRFSPDCVEMEGAAVAHIAAKNDVPSIVLRTLSDNADEEAMETLAGKPFDITEYCANSAAICEHILQNLAE